MPLSPRSHLPAGAKLIPVILCGGSGTRLWPLSREDCPKQFLKLNGDKTLLYETLQRAVFCADALPEDIITITLDRLKDKTLGELHQFDPKATHHLLTEPEAKNTAAAIAYAACYARKQFGPESLLWVMPSDHQIRDLQALKSALTDAVRASAENYLTTFGLRPDHPETGYGYIKASEAWNNSNSIFSVERFIEKPDHDQARQYIDEGDYFWNSGMFVFQVRPLLDAFKTFSPDIISPIKNRLDKNPALKALPPETYHRIESLPFDKAVMEQADNVAVIPCDIGWSDMGNWKNIWQDGKKDPDGNVIEGKVACIDSQNCLIHAHSLLIATIGLKDTIVIENSDSILIANINSDESIKALVNALKKAGSPEAITAPMEERPWGKFQTLSETPEYKIKEIVVRPGGKLSLQMHLHRCEFWMVAKGTADIEINGCRKTLKENDTAFIPLRAKHRLANTGNKDLVLVEFQYGDYLDEDDIIRFDDIYGRNVA